MTVDSFLDCTVLAKQEKEISRISSSTKTVQIQLCFRLIKMHTGQKSELITCVEVTPTLEHPSVDAVVLDGTAIVNMLSLTEKVLDF